MLNQKHLTKKFKNWNMQKVEVNYVELLITWKLYFMQHTWCSISCTACKLPNKKNTSSCEEVEPPFSIRDSYTQKFTFDGRIYSVYYWGSGKAKYFKIFKCQSNLL